MPDDAAYASQSDITGAFHYDIIYKFFRIYTNYVEKSC